MAGTISSIFSTLGTLTSTFGNLANNGSVGRISTYVSNTANLYLSANIYVAAKVGSTPPTANTPIYVYLARSDNVGYNDDNNGTTDASGTFINTPILGVINVASTGSAVLYYGAFDTSPLGPLGPAWGIGIVNNCGGSLMAGTITYVGMTYND